MLAILYNIRSLHNVGSIFRTADVAGISKIYLCGYTPAPVDKFGRKRWQIAKVSLGAEDYLEWEKVKSVTKLIKKLKAEKYKIFAIEQNKKSRPFNKIKLAQKEKTRVAILVGAETKGLPKDILEKAEDCVHLFHSYNLRDSRDGMGLFRSYLYWNCFCDGVYDS